MFCRRFIPAIRSAAAPVWRPLRAVTRQSALLRTQRIGFHASTSQRTATPNAAPNATPVGSETSGVDAGRASAEWIRFYRSVHRPITPLQRGFLAVGSAVLGFLNTHRGDMISVLGDTTGAPVLRFMHEAMSSTEEGRRVLTEKPRVDTAAIDFASLLALPADTLGHTYARWLQSHAYSPNERSVVRFVSDPELAYVMQRYREIHDVWHVLTGCPTSVLGEVAQKWWEAVQTTGLPVAVVSALVGPFRLTASEQTALASVYIPWALRSRTSIKVPLMAVYWEQYFNQPLADVRAKFGIEVAPQSAETASPAAAAAAAAATPSPPAK